MVRQPLSVAVPSTEKGRLHPLVPVREERLGEKGGAFLVGKEGRVGFRKNFFWLKGVRGVQKCIPSNHPITYQRYEKGNRHTPRSIRNIPHDYRSNRTTHYRHDKQ